MTINPLDFASAATVSVTILSGAFTDEANNPFDGTTGASGANPWSFTTIAPADKQVPTASLTPNNGATNVAITQTLSLTFSEAVKKGSGSITVSYGSTNTSIPISSVNLSTDNKTASFDPAPTGDLPNGATVSVTVPNTAFTDLANNAFVGTTGSSGASPWSFTTVAAADTQAPTVTTLRPGNGDQRVPIDADLILTFNEEIKKGTGSIRIDYSNGGSQIIDVVNGSVALSADKKTATINPPNNFPYRATIDVTVPLGAFEDVAGNKFLGINSGPGSQNWKFSAQEEPDVTAPTATLSPNNGKPDAAITDNLVLTFNEPINKGTGSILVNQSSGKSQTIDVATSGLVTLSADRLVVTINPTDFDYSVTISVTIPNTAFRDEANNPFAGTTGASGTNPWSFTTVAAADTQAPGLATRTPMHNATNVAISENLVLVFDEVVQAGSGNISITDGTTPQSISVTDASRVAVSRPIKRRSPLIRWTLPTRLPLPSLFLRALSKT